MRIHNTVIDYWIDCLIGPIRPKPRWTVTWPAGPDGQVWTFAVRRATGIADAIEQARTAYAPDNLQEVIQYSREPEVWQVKPGPARRVAGPDYYGEAA
ncbi:hypothetical protein [Streptomyces smyrnaeus]|uniref:hypothetical protein n=1 Tax=Streptomyces smyrnaeus TaxID=1387713 RepID=UPI00340E01B9